MRDAYKAAAQISISGLFEEQETKSVDALVGSLRERLSKSRLLLENAGQLASEGFSQTFIEQVVGAGVETGNQLASAILTSTPEVKGELKSLFIALERESASGMDSLANQIFQDQGLATDELKQLFARTQVELSDAMIQEQKQLQDALNDANSTFLETVREIKDSLKEQIEDMDGQFGGLGSTIDEFIGKLDELILKYEQLGAASTAVEDIAPPTISFQPDMPSGGISFMPISPDVSTGAMPGPGGNMFPTMPISNVGLGGTTIINITAKTDTTQSPAMVGKAIAKEVNKYTGGGGTLRTVQVGS